LRQGCQRMGIGQTDRRSLSSVVIRLSAAEGPCWDRSSSRSIFPVRESPLSVDTFVTSDKDVEDERSPPAGPFGGVARHERRLMERWFRRLSPVVPVYLVSR